MSILDNMCLLEKFTLLFFNFLNIIIKYDMDFKKLNFIDYWLHLNIIYLKNYQD